MWVVPRHSLIWFNGARRSGAPGPFLPDRD